MCSAPFLRALVSLSVTKSTRRFRSRPPLSNQATAVREVREETGIVAEIVTKLTDIKYLYVRNWGDGERVFKIVSFYLLRYGSGDIDDVTSEMRIEVKRALWVPLTEAARQLMYSNERK